MKKALATLSAGLVLLASSIAMASPDYPADINQDLGTSCPVQGCTLCHSSSSGGGAPTTPFGIAMVNNGLVPSNPTSLKNALTALDQQKLGGSPSYVDQLKACKDPNANSSVQAVGYGCNAGDGDASGGLVVAMAAFAALAIARKKRPA